MKFGKQLRFVAVKPWWDHYIQYKQFKKMINSYSSRIAEAYQQDLQEDQISTMKDEFYESFKEALIGNINECIRFFSKLVADATEKIDHLGMDIQQQLSEQEDTEKNEEEATALHQRLFVNTLNIYEIRSFLAINYQATHCITKKFTKKLVYYQCTEDFSAIAEQAFKHQPTIEEQLTALEDLFVTLRRDIYPDGDQRPRQEIILELHKSVENSLVWKQATVMGKWEAYTFRQNEFQLVSKAPIQFIPIIVGIVLMLPFMFAPIFPKNEKEAQRCLGILIFSATLWSTQAVPVWLTALSIPVFTVVAQLVPESSGRIVGKMIQGSMMSSTVFLIIGGFTIAAALQETDMDRRIASMILSRSTSSVRLFLFSVIMLNAFLAMWINNVASTMIVITLVIPILEQLPTESTFVQLILLGIAGGGNMGGMTTPLSSTQNAISMNVVDNAMTKRGYREDFGFVDFLAAAVAPAFISALVFWLLVQFIQKPDVVNVPPLPPVKADFGWRQILVCVVSLFTIALWITLPFGGENIFGDSGIVGFIPLIFFYGTGLLPASRLADLPWNLVFLVMGGNALGKVVEDSGLLRLISDLLSSALKGLSLWVTMFIIDLIVVVINIFVSHAVATTILLPIICDFALYDPHFRLFAMSAACATTASQILPVSSFPNLCCTSLEDANGVHYITTKLIAKTGAMGTVIAFLFIISLQYGILIAYGF